MSIILPTTSGMTCVKVPDWMDFGNILNGKGHDFWVSCLADVGVDDFPERIQSMRVEDVLAAEVFSHCYYRESNDIKTDADAIVAKVGLGLRKCRVKSKNVHGCVYVLMNNNGESDLSKQRAQLSADDRHLSAEERLRRTSMQIHVATSAHLEAEAKRHPGTFWLTSWTNCSAEEGMKKAVTTSMEGQLATQRFQRCLLADALDCRDLSSRLTSSCGLGLRKSAVRSKPESGCVALFLTGEGSPALPLPEREVVPRGKAAPGSSSAQVSAAVPKAASNANQSEPKRKREGGTADGAHKARRCEQDGHGRCEEVSEELHCQQIAVLEKRLMTLLPTLPREVLSTSMVQAKLEELMRKPRGRFDKFRMDIARIWRAYAAKT